MKSKKIIGLCTSRANEMSRAEFIGHLHKQISAMGCKLMVFNSHVDFSRNDAYTEGELSLFEIINYKLLDALIVVCDSFEDRTVPRTIIHKALHLHLPVLALGEDRGDCISIVRNSTEALKTLMNHVIHEHGITDTFFMAGREDDENSIRRLQCYKEVLRSNGLPFSAQNIGYGGFWDGPTRKVMKKLLDSGRPWPKAFFCANDASAISVCDFLAEQGVRVPEDVLVTGFDGVIEAEEHSPSIATCRVDWEDYASLVLRTIQDMWMGHNEPCVLTHGCSVTLGESCGCKKSSRPSRLTDTPFEMYLDMHAMDEHENIMFEMIDQLLEITDTNEFFNSLSHMMLHNSYVCLNKNFINEERVTADSFTLSSDLLYVPHVSFGEICPVNTMPLSEMIPHFDEWMNDDTMYILSPLHGGRTICGYYAIKTNTYFRERQYIKRISRSLNIIFNTTINQLRQHQLIQNVENASLTNPISGLANAKGLAKWFESFASVSDNHHMCLTFSVYNLTSYAYLYETYGIYSMEEIIDYIARALEAANTKECFLAQVAEDEFIVVNYYPDGKSIGDTINAATASFFAAIDEYNNQDLPYYLEINSGCSVVFEHWDDSLEIYIKAAVGEMYKNRMNNGRPDTTDSDTYRSKSAYATLTRILEENLLTYHFQPIVDAHTGEIYAYEALMRDNSDAKMSPLGMLECAQEYGRLPDIEHATLFNIMGRYAENADQFMGRKVFINTIPGYFLSEEESQTLRQNYCDYLDQFIFELTEQDSVSDAELQAVRSLCREGYTAQLAVDDFGTGHSNIVNLLRYKPQIIKIDRFLISGIDTDVNKQMFVKNTIDFARMNDIKVLAEGVETASEMKKVIEFGVDYIQGYYTGRPEPTPLKKINSIIVQEIRNENVRLSKYGNDMLSYDAADGEEILLANIDREKISFVNLSSGTYTVRGDVETIVDTVFRVSDDSTTTLILNNACLKGSLVSAIQMGRNCHVTIQIEGDNTILKDGIFVPPSSDLLLVGDGNLTIRNNRNYGVGIGSNFNDSFGDITIDITGHLNIQSSGDKVVGLGGGHSDGSTIHLKRGNIRVSTLGIYVLSIGSATGFSYLQVDPEVTLDAVSNGNNSVTIGSLSGETTMDICGNATIHADGEKAVMIGTLSGAACRLKLHDCQLEGESHCDLGCMLGTMSGHIEMELENAQIHIHGEGSNVAGIGALTGEAKTTIYGGQTDISVLSADDLPAGNANSTLVIAGGHVDFHVPMGISAISPNGDPLYPMTVYVPQYSLTIETDNGSYRYDAEAPDPLKPVTVYLPGKYIPHAIP